MSGLNQVGRCPEESASSISAALECGASTRFSINVSVGTKRILDARYFTNGCGFMVAAAEMVASAVRFSRLTHLPGADELRHVVSEAVGEVGPDRDHCIDVALMAFRDALAFYRSKLIDEFQGEKALVCTCFGVTEETVIEVISQLRPADVSEVSRACRAGSGCGSCQMLIRELIDSATI